MNLSSHGRIYCSSFSSFSLVEHSYKMYMIATTMLSLFAYRSWIWGTVCLRLFHSFHSMIRSMLGQHRLYFHWFSRAIIGKTRNGRGKPLNANIVDRQHGQCISCTNQSKFNVRSVNLWESKKDLNFIGQYWHLENCYSNTWTTLSTYIKIYSPLNAMT